MHDPPYEGCRIENIHRGKGERSKWVYAHVVSKDGRVLVAATLDYCAKVVTERTP